MCHIKIQDNVDFSVWLLFLKKPVLRMSKDIFPQVNLYGNKVCHTCDTYTKIRRLIR